jgi:ubiquinone/menaquinone biosynthesis C-methylase UbiE
LGAAGKPARRFSIIMEQYPICSYEGSDYQVSFWDRGGRAYEDAVEAVALKRLMPVSGRRLLELGAGAGRNTPRYHGFQHIVLLDYSLTQLQQARQRLGDTSPDGASLRYVAADVYHLPFIPALFDAATMIRTLHHLVDPRRALSQVCQSLQPGSPFILEFANKQNLKSILRYALRRQNWNPFSPEPVEFAPLNFDFHPATVRSWLKLNGFSIEQQLTVSHFRMGVLKRFVPLGLLVKMDALAQLTGNAWQLSPSVFVRAVVNRAAPAPSPSPTETDAYFLCPACAQSVLPDTPPELVCPACGQHYPVIDGIYDLRAPQAV